MPDDSEIIEGEIVPEPDEPTTEAPSKKDRRRHREPVHEVIPIFEENAYEEFESADEPRPTFSVSPTSSLSDEELYGPDYRPHANRFAEFIDQLGARLSGSPIQRKKRG